MPRTMRAAALMLVTGALAGCSSTPPAESVKSGQLAAGTASVEVNADRLPPVTAVSCSTVESFTTITTGDDKAGATLMVNNAKGLVADSVDIRDLGGFTGSYLRDLGKPADVTLADRTYTVTGTAVGFTAENPSARVPAQFTIKVSC